MSDPRNPSTYKPFSRWFTNERARELDETRALYQRLVGQHAKFDTTLNHMSDIVAETCLEGTSDHLFHTLEPIVWKVANEVLKTARHVWELPQPEFERMTMQEFVEYRNLLRAKEHFLANRAELLEVLYTGAWKSIEPLLRGMPEMEAPSPFTIPMLSAMSEPRLAIENVLSQMHEPYKRGLLVPLARQLYRNACRASGRDPDDEKIRKEIIGATDSKLPLTELPDAYLKKTPYLSLFELRVPLKLTHEERFNHWHVLAGSGQGKSTLIEQLITYDLQSDDPPSIVLIDPHSDLVRKLMRSPLAASRNVILFDPRDTSFPIALNPLAVNRERLERYDHTTREQVTAGVIQTFGYLWNGLTNLSLTGKQDTFFRYVTRLLLTIPEVRKENATILDMLKLMKDSSQYEDVIAALPPIPQDFFRADFNQKTFEGTKEQIRYRIQSIVENSTMERLFTAPESKIDFFTELNRGSIILIDTANDFLKDNSPVFGKLMISLILQAVLERAAIPENERKPTFLMIDEAGSFFSQNIDDLLTEARKYKCGLLLAHQYLDQASGQLRASLAANTGIKFAGGLSASDAAYMSREMRTDADFILSQPKLHFASFIRGVTPQAVSIPIELSKDKTRLSDEEYQSVIARNRERISFGMPTRPAAPIPHESPLAKRDPSSESQWV